MNAEKVLLPVIVAMLYGFNSLNIREKIQENKYIKTSYKIHYTNQKTYTDIKSAIDEVIQLTGGNVTKAEMKFKKDYPVWVISATGKDNCTFKVELTCEDNSLLKINAEEGPFEYELDPGENFISFSAAKKIAEEFTGVKTLKWNLYKNRKIWEYSFWLFLKSGKAQVRVNAESGEILTTKKKK